MLVLASILFEMEVNNSTSSQEETALCIFFKSEYLSVVLFTFLTFLRKSFTSVAVHLFIIKA